MTAVASVTLTVRGARRGTVGTIPVTEGEERIQKGGELRAQEAGGGEQTKGEGREYRSEVVQEGWSIRGREYEREGVHDGERTREGVSVVCGLTEGSVITVVHTARRLPVSVLLSTCRPRSPCRSGSPCLDTT